MKSNLNKCHISIKFDNIYIRILPIYEYFVMAVIFTIFSSLGKLADWTIHFAYINFFFLFF